MEEIIILKDTPHYKNYLKLQSKDTRTVWYKLYSSDKVGVRKIYSVDGLSIMCPGGPLIVSGELLPGYDYKVLQINHVNLNYYIGLENNDLLSNETTENS